MQQGPRAAQGCHLQQSLGAQFPKSWGFGLCFAPLAAKVVSPPYGNCTWLPWQSGHPWLRVVSSYEFGFSRRINTSSLQKTDNKILHEEQCQRSHAEPRIKESQALSSSMLLHPFMHWISRTQAGERDGSVPAIPEGHCWGIHISGERRKVQLTNSSGDSMYWNCILFNFLLNS